MHVPDGFLEPATSVATALTAAGAVTLSLQRANQELQRSGPALPGLVAAVVFATQMVNFPVGVGTSGHLMGGTLAAVLVGPWTAVLCMTVVLVIQALLFADGGLTALGTNITLLGVVAVVVGYLTARMLLTVLPRRTSAIVPAAAVGAFVSVPAAATAFVLLYAVGGAVPVSLGPLATAMVGWHLVVGVGEALITAAILGAVMASRPDLVYLNRLRHKRPETLTVSTAGGGRAPLVAGLAVALIVAGVVTMAASAHPDGLEFVADKLGFAEAARDSATAGSPLADYGIAGLAGHLSTATAGALGVLMVLGAGIALAALARRVHRRGQRRPPSVPTGS